jgi:hypothetical protein
MPARVCSLFVVMAAVSLAVPATVTAQDVPSNQFDPAGFDTVGDSPHAPDIGKVQHSVRANGGFRRVVIGVWVNRNELAEGEQVRVYFDWTSAGGDPYFGGDHLFLLDGNDPPYADRYWTYAWSTDHWVQQDLNNPSVNRVADGRIYFEVDFNPGGSTPENPARVGLRVSSIPAGPGQYIDYAPDAGQPNMAFSLEPHGAADPLEGCTYAGGCVGGAAGPGNFGPQENSGGDTPPGTTNAACTSARNRLSATTRRLRRARRAMKKAGSRAAYRARRRTVRKLKRRQAAAQRLVAIRC